jgi:hypothetical protein
LKELRQTVSQHIGIEDFIVAECPYQGVITQSGCIVERVHWQHLVVWEHRRSLRGAAKQPGEE